MEDICGDDGNTSNGIIHELENGQDTRKKNETKRQNRRSLEHRQETPGGEAGRVEDEKKV